MIYQIKNRLGVVIFEHEIRGSRTQSVPAVDFVDIEFDYYEPILLERNYTLDFEANTFYCDKQFNSVVKRSAHQYSHRARFVSENYVATDIALLDANGAHVFEIEGNLLTLLTLALNNLNRRSSGWTLGTVPNTVTKLFSVSGDNVMSFLAKVSGEFNIPFEIKNKVVQFGDIIHTQGDEFRYGKGNGLTEITKNSKNEKVPNTIYATGGNGFQLDLPVIDEGDRRLNGIIEGFYTNERIFPTTGTTVKRVDVANQNLFYVDLDYYIPNYFINGQRALINFETGDLAGLSFYIYNVLYNTDNENVITLIPRTVDGTTYPNGMVRPQSGDRFNITNITMPDEAVEDAKERLETDTFNMLRYNILRNIEVSASLDPLVNKRPELNSKIRIVDTDLDLNDDFFVNEVKTYLQDLNRQEMKLTANGNWYLNLSLPTVNENIIDVSLDGKITNDSTNLITNNLELVNGDKVYNFSENGFKMNNSTLKPSLGDSNIQMPDSGITERVIPIAFTIGGVTKYADSNGIVNLD